MNKANLYKKMNIDNVLEKLKQKLEKGFNLDVELVELCEDFAEELKKLNISQSSIRNIYNSFKSIQLGLQQKFIKLFSESIDDIKKDDAENKAFQMFHPKIRLMKSKANYVLERKKADIKGPEDVKKGYTALKQFIFIFIENINSKKEFDNFMDLFECILGNLK